MPTTSVSTLLEDALQICVVPAPTFAEAERARLVRSMFAALGAPARIDDAGNVVCRLGGDDGAVTVFAAHLDTVFGAGQPIAIVRDEAAGRVCAPGIGDDSLGVAALLALVRLLSRSPAARPVVLAATVGEEGLGDLHGARQLLETLDCRAFVAVEGAMLDSIKTAGIGSTRLRVHMRGPGGHSWNDRGTPSAVHAIVALAARFLAEPAPAGLARNIGTLSGGTTVNTIAAEATLELDLRAEDEVTLAGAAHAARSAFARPPSGLTADVQTIGQRPCGATDPEHPLLVAARRARAEAGLPPACEGASSTDANAAYGRGIPAITVGLTTGGGAHRIDEYIDLAPLAGGLDALERLALAVSTGLRA